jgi:hypothetical protein
VVGQVGMEVGKDPVGVGHMGAMGRCRQPKAPGPGTTGASSTYVCVAKEGGITTPPLWSPMDTYSLPMVNSSPKESGTGPYSDLW